MAWCSSALPGQSTGERSHEGFFFLDAVDSSRECFIFLHSSAPEVSAHAKSLQDAASPGHFSSQFGLQWNLCFSQSSCLHTFSFESGFLGNSGLLGWYTWSPLGSYRGGPRQDPSAAYVVVPWLPLCAQPPRVPRHQPQLASTTDICICGCCNADTGE